LDKLEQLPAINVDDEHRSFSWISAELMWINAQRAESGLLAHHLIRGTVIFCQLLSRHSFDFLKCFRTIL
jgi:hypothetical protein